MIKIKRAVLLIIIFSFITIPVVSKEDQAEENKKELFKNTMQYYLDTGKTFSYLKRIKKTRFFRITFDISGDIEGLKSNYTRINDYYNDTFTSGGSGDLDADTFNVSITAQYLFSLLRSKYFNILAGIGPGYRFYKLKGTSEITSYYTEGEYTYFMETTNTIKSYGLAGSLCFETKITQRIGIFGDYTFSYYYSKLKSDSYSTDKNGDPENISESSLQSTGERKVFSYGKFRFGIYVGF